MKPPRQVFRIVPVLLLCIGSISAQELQDTVQIEQVEIRASRVEDAGAKATVVDTTILQHQMSASLSELLSQNTSVFIKNHGRGALATASFRGTSPSHSQVQWNGIDLNSPMTGMVDFSLVPVYIIDELSLRHGAASLADRSGGIGGSIRIGNSPGWDQGRSLKYSQGIGSYRTLDEYLFAGFGKKVFRSKTRMYHNSSANNYTFVNYGIGEIDPLSGEIVHPIDTNGNASYRRYGLLQEFYYRPAASQLLSFKYWAQAAARVIPKPSSYEGPDNANLNKQTDIDHRLVADWKGYGDRGQLLLRTGYASKRLDFIQRNRIAGLGLDTSIYAIGRQQSWMNTLSLFPDVGTKLELEATIDARFHDVSSHDRVTGLAYERQRNEWSFLLSARRKFRERFTINLMLRQEWIEGRRVPVIPFVGADFKLIRDRNLFLKAHLARNYHQPTLNDLYWQPGGNPGLLPEEGFSMEAGLAWSGGIPRLEWESELTVFRSDIHNWILWIPSFKGYWEPMNIRRVETTGFEAGLKLKGTAGPVAYRFGGQYALSRALNYGDPLVWGDESYGKQLVYTPLHSGNAFFRVAYRSFFLSWQHNSYSERFTSSSNDPTSRHRLYPYFMNDLSAGAEFRLLKMDFRLELKVHNLFDEAYHSVLFRPMPGRHYYLLLQFEL